MKKTALFLSLALIFGITACDKQTTQTNNTKQQTQTVKEPESVVYKMKNYDEVSSFYNGLAAVQKDGKWGFIDKTGKEVAPLQYDDAQGFNQELAAVKKDGKWGFVDKTAKERTAMIYEQIWSLNHGYFAVQKDITNWNGGILRWGIVDGFALEVVPAIQRNNNFVSFSPDEGLFQFTTTENRVGFVDKQGREVVPFQYDDISMETDEGSICKEGLCVVAKNNKWGFVDTTGRLAVMLQYEYASDFNEGLAAVKKNNKWGFVDKTGKEVIALQYDSAHDFSEGLSFVKKGEQWLLIDKTGKEIAALPPYEWVGHFENGLAQVFKNELVGFIDKTGKEVIACQYENIYDKDGTPFVGNGLLTVAQNGKWGLIDAAGKVVVPPQYDNALMQSDETNEELFLVSQDFNRFGFMDKNGKLVIPVQYDFAYPFSDGLAFVKKEGIGQFIDKTGKVVIDTEESKEYKADPAILNAPPLPQRFKIDSSQYKVPLYTGQIASELALKPDFDDWRLKENLKAALEEAQADKQNINFAGKYMLVESGCGVACLIVAVLDVETGKMFDDYLVLSGYPVKKDGTPYSEEEVTHIVNYDVAHQKDSRLMFVQGGISAFNDNDDKGRGSFAFEFKDGKFHFLQHSPVVKMEEI